MEKRIGPNSMTPGQRSFGLPGRGTEEQIATLIASGGRDPAAVKAPLSIADRIAENLSSDVSGLRDTVSAGMGGVAARVVAKPNVLDRMREAERIKRDLTKLLQNASPQEIERLMQLSMFDPKLRTAITMMSAGIGGVQGSEK
jgi:hypothetical protein